MLHICREAIDLLENYPDEWYRRTDENSWRPIAQRILAEDCNIASHDSKAPNIWCCLPSVRKKRDAQTRKQKRFQWMLSMYKDGKQHEVLNTGDDELQDITEEYTELIDWSDHLDFESYTQ